MRAFISGRRFGKRQQTARFMVEPNPLLREHFEERQAEMRQHDEELSRMMASFQPPSEPTTFVDYDGT